MGDRFDRERAAWPEPRTFLFWYDDWAHEWKGECLRCHVVLGMRSRFRTMRAFRRLRAITISHQVDHEKGLLRDTVLTGRENT